jgi:Transposase IS116/IS110/IS902 family/KaiC
MRLLAEEPLRFRRQVLALKQFFAARKATVLLLEELILNGNGRDMQLLSLSHGVIRLERWTLDFGGARRRVEITKMRGTTSREGWHDYKIRTGGIEVFPTLVAAEHVIPFIGEPVPSGLAELDLLLACPRGQAGAGSTGSHQDRAGHSPSGRPGSDRARRVRTHHPQGGRRERRPACRNRQFERVSVFYAAGKAARTAMRGMTLVNAATLIAELGDLSRFANPRQLMAYLGLVPSEQSSGARVAGGLAAARAPHPAAPAPGRGLPHARHREPTPPSTRRPGAASPGWMRPADRS